MEKKTVIIEVQTEDGVKQLDRLSAKFDEVYGDILPLTASIGELEDQLYQMALEGKQGTEEFKTMSAEAGRLKKTLQQVDLEVDALSMTTANKLGGALGGAASGFELVQGAMGAMGADSAFVEEALLKVNSAMAMAQGIQGLKEAAPAFKALGGMATKAFGSIRAAIASTGVGLLIVAVGLLASNWDKVKGAVGKASKSFTDYLNSGTKGSKALKWYLDALVLPITLAIKGYNKLKDAIMGTSDATRAIEKAQKAQHDKMMKQADEERKAREENLKGLDRKIALLEAEGKSTIKLREEKLKLQKQEAEANLVAMEALMRMAKGNELLTNAYSDMLNSAKDSLNNVKIEEAKLAQERRNANKQANEDYKAILQEKADKEKEARDKQKEEDDKALEEKIRQEELANAWQLEQEQIIADEKAAKEEKQRADEEEMSAFRIKLWEREAEEAKRLEEQKLATRKQAIKTSIDLTQQSLSVIGDLVDAFSAQDEASQRKAFKIKKAASIASAVIDTYKGASSAYAETPGGVVLKTIAAGVALASGFAKVKAISNTKFEGGGSSSSSSSEGSPSPSMSMPAQFNVVGNSGTNQIAQGLSNTVVKAFVVSGDVTTAQSLDRNKVQTASL